ncbi:hypothetical protein Nepgr_007607 [Nepenthes gracilis]|uniref:Uncharacterized protein n=1 Tax=Nepenthes gracilis TaxID=150966 RepID=A0AAD3S771_NEPGR|nr:hypothetical protein Nepgr_007607 [Nepenthes gracilis]
MGDPSSPMEPLISRRSKNFSRVQSHAHDELHSFRSCLRWMCVDQSNCWSACLSWSVFVLFAILVPSFSHFFLSCPSCDSRHRRPYDTVVQLSLSSIATLSFVSLSVFVRKYGLRRFLFFDKLVDESEAVRENYTAQLNRSLKLCFIFVLPCFVADAAYKIWWYSSGASQIPFLGNAIVSDTVACLMELFSWLYRTTIFFLICVLFRLICYLQILRLQDFAKVFQVDSDVGSVLVEHLRIRRQLRIISHRFRAFILWSLLLITMSQFASLLMTTESHANVNIFRAGELALCSVTLVTGLMIILRSATKITHKALAITCLAAKWHVCATIDSFSSAEAETPMHQNADAIFAEVINRESEGEDPGDEEDELDNTKLIPAYAYSTISFQKRQALVNYFENNRAGITVYGFLLDRAWLQLIFGIEMSLVLWLLGKTVGIS